MIRTAEGSNFDQFLWGNFSNSDYIQGQALRCDAWDRDNVESGAPECYKTA
jgi:hypothetical protein